MFHPSNLFYNVVRALVLPNYWATMVKIKWHVQFHFSCKIYVEFSGEVLLLKFWQCEHHSEQSKPYFESFTFMHQAKMFTKTRSISTFSVYIFIKYFDFVWLHFRRCEYFIGIWQFKEPDSAFSFNCCSTDCGVFLPRQSDPLFSFTANCENFVVNHE